VAPAEHRVTVRLLFIDDHPIVADGLVRRFTRPGFTVVGATSTVDHALRLVSTQRVDVVVLDVQLELLITPAHVAALAHHARVVLFSSRRVDQHVRSLLEAGATCFVDKALPLDQFDATLRAVAAGQAPQVQQPAGVRALLSEREYEVYRTLVSASTPKEIAARLGIATSTVYCHLESVKKKLDVRSVPELVAHALTHRDS
jgi:DNA-binding NarL/FixJ family response regulator